jgi:hypothetical protein
MDEEIGEFTRFEVIDWRDGTLVPRAYGTKSEDWWDISAKKIQIKAMVQDDGKTLKIFLEDSHD